MIGDTSPLGRCAKEAEALSGFAVTVNKVEWDKTGGSVAIQLRISSLIQWQICVDAPRVTMDAPISGVFQR